MGNVKIRFVYGNLRNEALPTWWYQEFITVINSWWYLYCIKMCVEQMHNVSFAAQINLVPRPHPPCSLSFSVCISQQIHKNIKMEGQQICLSSTSLYYCEQTYEKRMGAGLYPDSECGRMYCTTAVHLDMLANIGHC